MSLRGRIRRIWELSSKTEEVSPEIEEVEIQEEPRPTQKEVFIPRITRNPIEEITKETT